MTSINETKIDDWGFKHLTHGGIEYLKGSIIAEGQYNVTFTKGYIITKQHPKARITGVYLHFKSLCRGE